MQITLVQAEIETAIRNYILGQIAVREDHRIDIDLKATRGDAGFQAFIDIVPEGDKPTGAKAPVAAKPAAAVAKPVDAAPVSKPAPTGVFKRAKTEAPAEEPAAVEPAVELEAAVPAETVSNVTPINKTEEAPAADEGAEAPRSIFSNLRKPVNAASA